MGRAIARHMRGERGLAKDQKGVSTVEYIIVLVLIAIACIAIWNKFGRSVHEKIRAADDGISGLETDYGD